MRRTMVSVRGFNAPRPSSGGGGDGSSGRERQRQAGSGSSEATGSQGSQSGRRRRRRATDEYSYSDHDGATQETARASSSSSPPSSVSATPPSSSALAGAAPPPPRLGSKRPRPSSGHSTAGAAANGCRLGLNASGPRAARQVRYPSPTRPAVAAEPPPNHALPPPPTLPWVPSAAHTPQRAQRQQHEVVVWPRQGGEPAEAAPQQQQQHEPHTPQLQEQPPQEQQQYEHYTPLQKGPPLSQPREPQPRTDSMPSAASGAGGSSRGGSSPVDVAALFLQAMEANRPGGSPTPPLQTPEPGSGGAGGPHCHSSPGAANSAAAAAAAAAPPCALCSFSPAAAVPPAPLSLPPPLHSAPPDASSVPSASPPAPGPAGPLFPSQAEEEEEEEEDPAELARERAMEMRLSSDGVDCTPPNPDVLYASQPHSPPPLSLGEPLSQHLSGGTLERLSQHQPQDEAVVSAAAATAGRTLPDHETFLPPPPPPPPPALFPQDRGPPKPARAAPARPAASPILSSLLMGMHHAGAATTVAAKKTTFRLQDVMPRVAAAARLTATEEVAPSPVPPPAPSRPSLPPPASPTAAAAAAPASAPATARQGAAAVLPTSPFLVAPLVPRRTLFTFKAAAAAAAAAASSAAAAAATSHSSGGTASPASRGCTDDGLTDGAETSTTTASATPTHLSGAPAVVAGSTSAPSVVSAPAYTGQEQQQQEAPPADAMHARVAAQHDDAGPAAAARQAVQPCKAPPSPPSPLRAPQLTPPGPPAPYVPEDIPPTPPPEELGEAEETTRSAVDTSGAGAPSATLPSSATHGYTPQHATDTTATATTTDSGGNAQTTPPTTAAVEGPLPPGGAAAAAAVAETDSDTEDERRAPPLDPGTFYGLPAAVGSLYCSQRGVKELHAWQKEVLGSAALRAGRNFVYSLPTSGGKTLVAEVTLLQCVLNRGQSCLFVLPFVSLVEEKVRLLEPLADRLNFRLEGHYGTAGRLPPLPAPSVFVCTFEKACLLLNSLVADKRAAAEVGLAVVDELHMLSDGSRGATLEKLLASLLLLSDAQRVEGLRPAQIVGMSATIPNLPTVARWLRAKCYIGSFRPIPLTSYAVLDGVVLEDGERPVRTLTGGDPLMELATELPPDSSVLVFCFSRRQTAEVALRVVQYLMRQDAAAAAAALGGDAEPPGITDAASLFQRQQASAAPFYTQLERASAAKLASLEPAARAAVQTLQGELCSLSHREAGQLARLLPFGVSFHNAGLMKEERALIEQAYRERTVRILCCTSTLAAGVNLPARRVVLQSPRVGLDGVMSKAQYQQMCGRAGRAGLDPYGESFLVLDKRSEREGLALVHRGLEDSRSQALASFTVFQRAVLECVATGIFRSRAGARRWARSLLAAYAPGPLDPAAARVLAAHAATLAPAAAAAADTPLGRLEVLIDHALLYLSSREFLTLEPREGEAGGDNEMQEEEAEEEAEAEEAVPTPSLLPRDTAVTPTPFGSTSVRAGFSVDEAVTVRRELVEVQQRGIILADELHLCYYATPLREVGDCDWDVYLEVWVRLSEARTRIGMQLGVDDKFLLDRRGGYGPGGNPHAEPAGEEERRRYFAARRFFVALILADVLAEVPYEVIAERFRVTPGYVQNLSRAAAAFSGSITRFCAAMGWTAMEALLQSLARRLDAGVRPDLLPLTEIPGMTPARARALAQAGYRSPAQLAAADPAEMVARVRRYNAPSSNVARHFGAAAATRVRRSAEMLLQHKIREKQAELDELARPQPVAAEPTPMPW